MRIRSLMLLAAGPVLFASTAQAVPMDDLVLWLRADAGVEETVGDPAESGDGVQVWRDQSGQNNHVSLSPNVTNRTSTQPDWLTGQVNGQPAVRFDRVGDSLQASSTLLSGNTDFHFFAVFANTGIGEKVIAANYGLAPGATTGVEFYIYHHPGSTPPGSRRPTAYKQGSAVSPDDVVNGQYYLYEVESYVNAGNAGFRDINLYVDGDFKASITVPRAIGGTLNWTLGTLPEYGSSNGPAAPLLIAEQLLYLDDLAPAERTQAIAELGIKYGLNVPVPEPASLGLLAAGSLLLLRRRA